MSAATLLLTALAVALLVALAMRRGGGAPPHAMPAALLPSIAPSDVADWLAAHPRAVVLDVRTSAEFAEGHLAGARHLDVQAPDFPDRAAALAADTPYVVYCRSGMRSDRAGRHLLALGHAPVVNAGGFEALARAGLATTR